MSSTPNKRGREESPESEIGESAPESGIKRNRQTPFVLANATHGSSHSQDVLHDVVSAWKSFVLSELERAEKQLRDQQETQRQAAERALSESAPTDLVSCPLYAAHTTIHGALGHLVDATFAGSRSFRFKLRKESTIPCQKEIHEAVDRLSAEKFKVWRWELLHKYGPDMDNIYGSDEEHRRGSNWPSQRNSKKTRDLGSDRCTPVHGRQADKRLAETLPNAIATAESLYSESLGILDALKARLELVTDVAYRSDRMPTNNNDPSVTFEATSSVNKNAEASRETVADRLEVSQLDWLKTAARSLHSTDRSCYFERIKSALTAHDNQELRTRDYVVDRVAFDGYIRGHSLRTNGGQGPDAIESLDSLVTDFEKLHKRLDKDTLSARYFAVVGRQILGTEDPLEIWDDFFSTHEALVREAVDNGDLSSIASTLKADFADYYQSWKSARST